MIYLERVRKIEGLRLVEPLLCFALETGMVMWLQVHRFGAIVGKQD